MSEHNLLMTPRGSILTSRGSIFCGCNPGQGDITFDPPFRNRKSKSISNVNDIDIPIYNWRKESYIGVPENKNLRKGVGTKRQAKESALKLENSNLKKLLEFKNLPQEDVMRMEL